MTEAEILDRMFDVIQGVLTVFSIFFTLISGYLAALYLFLRQAPFLLRTIAFGLLSTGLAFLGGTAAVIGRLQDGLFTAWGKLPAPALSLRELTNPLPIETASMGLTQQQIGVAVGWIVAVAVYLALGYLTFLYRWPDPQMADQHSPNQPKSQHTSRQDR